MTEREEYEEHEDELEECSHPFHEAPEADDAVFDDLMELLMNAEAEPWLDKRGARERQSRPGSAFRALLTNDKDQSMSSSYERCPRCARPRHQKAARS